MENSKKLENSTLAIILSVISILISVFFNGEKLLRNLCWLLEKNRAFFTILMHSKMQLGTLQFA